MCRVNIEKKDNGNECLIILYIPSVCLEAPIPTSVALGDHGYASIWALILMVLRI